jgi:hypothetical protein
MLIDHSSSPGVPDELWTKSGLPPGMGREKFESATFTCSHCERVVIMNPDRSRARGYCPRCDHYVCDACENIRAASGGECYPYKAKMYDLMNEAAKAEAATGLPTKIIIP